MRHTRTFLAILALTAVAGGSGASAAPLPGPEALQYAADHGVSPAEAVRRFALQDRAGLLEGSLAADPSFGGLYVTHSPGFGVVVHVTNAAATARARDAAAARGLGAVTSVRTVRWSLAQLVSAADAGRRAVERAGVRAQSGVDVVSNSAEVRVADPAAVSRTGVRLAAPAGLVRGLGREAADVYGGLTMSAGCTTGFSVRNSAMTRGVLTAGHCSDAVQQVNGAVVDFVFGENTGAYDQQWHTSAGNTIQPTFFDGSYARTVVGMKARSSQTVNEYVCKYGRITGYNCGYISDKNYNWGGNNNSATWIRVRPTGAALIKEGDSGGPWFRDHIAYGITKGYVGSDGVYQAIDFISHINVVLLTG